MKEITIVDRGEEGIQIVTFDNDLGDFVTCFSSQSLDWWLKNEVGDSVRAGWIVRIVPFAGKRRRYVSD